jgi:hypothetical protein
MVATMVAMTYWLKAFGSAAKPLNDDWQSEKGGVLKTAATFAKRPMVAKGDRIVYYAAGTKLIFAAGVVTSHPHKDATNSQWPWRVDVALDVKKGSIHKGAALGLIQCPTSKNNVCTRIMRRSHVQLSADEYAAAVAALTA